MFRRLGPVTKRVAPVWLAALSFAADSVAEPKQAPPALPVSVSGGSGPHCVIRGTSAVPRDVVLYDAASGGQPIANLTGVPVTLTLSDFPKAPGAGRARVETGSTAGGFRISGFVAAERLPLYAGRELEVVPNHVWIGTGQQLTFLGSAPGKLQIEKRVASSVSQVFQTWAPCDALSFNDTPPPGWTVPGEARGYLAAKPEIAILSGPGQQASTAITLQKSAWSDGILFWSTKLERGYVEVEHHDQVVVKGWARQADLKALPKGETYDQVQPTAQRKVVPKLRLQGKPQSIKIPKSVAVRLAPRESGKEVGYIMPGTEVYVIDTVAGWSNVLPGELNITGPGDNTFWVRASDIQAD